MPSDKATGSGRSKSELGQREVKRFDVDVIDRDAFEAHVRTSLGAVVADAFGEGDLAAYVAMASGGRFLRSKLAFAAAIQPTEQLADICVAMELLHASTLIHDDLIDGATSRHGYPTINSELPVGSAVLAGNLLLASAISRARSGPQRASDLLLKAYREVCAAQELELEERARLLKSWPNYERVVQGKTVAMMVLPIDLANAPGQVRHVQRQIVRSFAMAFQLIDDIEDIEAWRAGQQHGSKGSPRDLANGTYTAPALFACRGDDTRADVRAVDPTLITESDWSFGIRRARTLANEYLEDTTSTLDQLESGNFRVFVSLLVDSLRRQGVDETVRR